MLCWKKREEGHVLTKKEHADNQRGTTLTIQYGMEKGSLEISESPVAFGIGARVGEASQAGEACWRTPGLAEGVLARHSPSVRRCDEIDSSK